MINLIFVPSVEKLNSSHLSNSSDLARREHHITSREGAILDDSAVDLSFLPVWVILGFGVAFLADISPSSSSP